MVPVLDHARQVLRHGLAGARSGRPVSSRPRLGQLRHGRQWTPPAALQVLHVGVARRGQVAQVGGLLARSRWTCRRSSSDAALMGDGQAGGAWCWWSSPGPCRMVSALWKRGLGHDVPGRGCSAPTSSMICMPGVLGQPQRGRTTRRGWCRCPAGPCRWPRCRQFMELAVYMPEQEPQVGQALFCVQSSRPASSELMPAL